MIFIFWTTVVDRTMCFKLKNKKIRLFLAPLGLSNRGYEGIFDYYAVSRSDQVFIVRLGNFKSFYLRYSVVGTNRVTVNTVKCSM